MAKKSAAKKFTGDQVWSEGQWKVRFGSLNAPRGSAGGVERLFRVIGEKIPFGAINRVNAHLRSQGVPRQGVYVAHDSMGYARYVGRGRIFPRLRACKSSHKLEVEYFSFYVVKEKKHEREIETLLIHVAGPLLQFNTKKKRVTISAGSIQDYEVGTRFFQRHYKKGKKSQNGK